MDERTPSERVNERVNERVSERAIKLSSRDRLPARRSNLVQVLEIHLILATNRLHTSSLASISRSCSESGTHVAYLDVLHTIYRAPSSCCVRTGDCRKSQGPYSSLHRPLVCPTGPMLRRISNGTRLPELQMPTYNYSVSMCGSLVPLYCVPWCTDSHHRSRAVDLGPRTSVKTGTRSTNECKSRH